METGAFESSGIKRNDKRSAGINTRAQLFESRLALNPAFFFWRSKAFCRVIFYVIFRASNHQQVDKKN